MSATDGILRPIYEVHCRGCERAMLGLSQHRREAVDMLTGLYNWQHIGGKWFCWDCCDKTSRKALLTIAKSEVAP